MGLAHELRRGAAIGLVWIAAGGCSDDGESDNHAPVVDSLAARPPAVLVDSVASVMVWASDGDGDRLSFRWSATAGEFPHGPGEDSVAWRAPATAGPCTLTVLASDGGSMAWGSLMVPVLDPDPLLEIEPDTLELAPGITRAHLRIRNAGTGVLTWSLAADAAWLSLSPAAGATAEECDSVAVTVDRYGLAAGTCVGRVTALTNAGFDTVVVSLGVAPPPIYGYTVLHIYPHDSGAFTQGLVYREGYLYEGTGRQGESSLRQVDLATGVVLQRRDLDRRYFGEGIAILGERVFQLTLSHHVGFTHDRATFAPIGEFRYPTEGWGLTHDGSRMILSDGSDRLYFHDPETFTCVDTIAVRDLNQPVRLLNELEYVRGEIYANIWMENRIARISPRTGEVLGWIDLTGLRGPVPPQPPYVLNGIAWDETGERLFVTGKHWSTLYEIELVPPAPLTARAPAY